MTLQPGGEPAEDDYPYYEETVTESTWHYKAGHYLHGALEARYAERNDVFVGANNFIYWQQGKKSRKQSPDVYVCFGARNQDRRSYKTWEEGGIAPQVVFELTSESSRFTDQGTKKAVYEALGVEEYYLFDPLREYIKAGLLAFENRNGLFQPRKGKRLYSPRLELDLRVEGKLLRLFLPGSSERLLTQKELQIAHREAERARVEAERARVEAERARVEAERARVEAEERAARMAAELAELKRRLEQS